MCVVNNIVLPVLFFQKQVGKRVLDPLNTNGIWLIWNVLELQVDGVKVGKQGWK